MKRLINFTKRNSGIILSSIALVVLTTLLLIMAPAEIENNGGTPTATAIALYVLTPIASSVVIAVILNVLENDDDR